MVINFNVKLFSQLLYFFEISLYQNIYLQFFISDFFINFWYMSFIFLQNFYTDLLYLNVIVKVNLL